LGGSIPPVMWDGVTAFHHPDGGALSTDVVKLAITDGPVANLNLKLQGTPITQAQPAVVPAINDGPLVPPMPVLLPAAQLSLASAP